jgi:hypothetical protein
MGFSLRDSPLSFDHLSGVSSYKLSFDFISYPRYYSPITTPQGFFNKNHKESLKSTQEKYENHRLYQ